MHINDLPDDCLIMIFQKLPLRDIIVIGTVCKCWITLQNLTLRVQKSLKLCKKFVFENYENMKFLSGDQTNFLDDAIKCEDIDSSVCMMLLQKFKMLKKFHVYGCYISDFEHFHFLLTSWSNNLNELVFFVNDNQKSFNHVETFSLMKSLRQLVLNHITIDDIKVLVPILPNLERISFDLVENEDTDEPLLNESNIDLIMTNIGIKIRDLHVVHNNNQVLTSSMKKNSWELPFKFYSNLKCLSLGTVDDSIIQLICDNCLSLTHLNINLYERSTLMNLLSKFVRLTQLSHLQLMNPVNSIIFYPFYKVSPRNYCRRLQQMMTIKTFKTNFELNSHRIKYLRHIFPNVENLIFFDKLLRCSCHFSKTKCKYCSEQIFLEFLKFKTLRKVYHHAKLILDFNTNSVKESIESIYLLFP